MDGAANREQSVGKRGDNLHGPLGLPFRHAAGLVQPAAPGAEYLLIILGVFGLAWGLDVPGLVALMRLPPLNMLSYNRFVFAASFALLAMTATGSEVLFNEEIRPRWWFSLPLVTLLVIAGWCLYQAVALPEPVASQPEATIKSGKILGSIQTLADVREIQGWFIHTYLVVRCLLAWRCRLALAVLPRGTAGCLRCWPVCSSPIFLVRLRTQSAV